MIDNKPNIWVLDDDAGFRKQINWALSEDYSVHLFTVPKEVEEWIKQGRKADLALIDLNLSPFGNDQSGLQALSNLMDQDPKNKVIVISGQLDRCNASKAMDMGAFICMSKPVELNELRHLINHALYIHSLERENERLKQELKKAIEERALDASGISLGPGVNTGSTYEDVTF